MLKANLDHMIQRSRLKVEHGFGTAKSRWLELQCVNRKRRLRIKQTIYVSLGTFSLVQAMSN